MYVTTHSVRFSNVWRVSRGLPYLGPSVPCHGAFAMFWKPSLYFFLKKKIGHSVSFQVFLGVSWPFQDFLRFFEGFSQLFSWLFFFRSHSEIFLALSGISPESFWHFPLGFSTAFPCVLLGVFPRGPSRVFPRPFQVFPGVCQGDSQNLWQISWDFLDLTGFSGIWGDSPKFSGIFWKPTNT